MVKLDSSKKIQQAIKDIKYRLNSMMAYDIYNYIFENRKDEFGQLSVYRQSHLLEPSFEISIIFGRQLLDFLQIGHNKSTDQLENSLEYKKEKIKKDDLFLSSFSGVSKLPITDAIVELYDRQIKSIIKVANKASAHMTFSHTLPQEFEEIQEIKPIILDLCLKYVPGLSKENIWWFERDQMKNAYIK